MILHRSAVLLGHGKISSFKNEKAAPSRAADSPDENSITQLRQNVEGIKTAFLPCEGAKKQAKTGWFLYKMHRFFQFLLIKNTTYRDFSQAIRQFFSTLYRNHPVFACFFAPSQGRKAVFIPSTFCRNCVILFSSGLSAALEGAAFSFLKEDIFP
jgi:hypothetical protein